MLTYEQTFLAAYIEGALWSTNDESDPETGGVPMDSNYGPEDLDPDCRKAMETDCKAFIETNKSDLEDMSAESAGHDFWLTRNGHGAGFWDRNLGEIGQRLTAASKTYREFNLYIGDDGKIHV